MEKRKFFRRDDIMKRIADNFGGADFPGERESVAEATDEAFTVLGELGTDWKKADPSKILWNDDKSVTSLSRDGFHYFLPAFLSVVFDQGKEINEDLFFDELLNRLSEDSERDVSGYYDKGRRALLSDILASVAQDTENDEVRNKIEILRARF